MRFCGLSTLSANVEAVEVKSRSFLLLIRHGDVADDGPATPEFLSDSSFGEFDRQFFAIVSNFVNVSGSCSRWTRRGCRCRIVHAPSRPPQSEVPGRNNGPKRRNRKADMVLVERHQGARRMEGLISWSWAKYCWKCVKLGSLLSLVSLLPCIRRGVHNINSYNMLKKRASGGDPTQSLSAGAYLVCSAQASSQSLKVYMLFSWN